MWTHMHLVESVYHARWAVSCQRRYKSQYSKALRYGNDSPFYLHAHTSINMPQHMYTCHLVERDMRRNVTVFLDRLVALPWDAAEGPQWVLKQRGISINKGALTAQLHWKNAQRCVEDFGITITCDLWFMNGVDKFMDVCWSRFLCSSSSSSRCA